MNTLAQAILLTIPVGESRLVTVPAGPQNTISCPAIGPMASHYSRGTVSFYLPVPYKLAQKSFQCSLGPRSVSVVARPVSYPTKKLNVPKKYVDLSPKDLARWKREKKLKEKIFSSRINTPYFHGPFIRPLSSKVTSPFGHRRVFNNQRDSWHKGTDFRAPIGTQVRSTHRGIVRFAGEFYFDGKAVIIEHGMGVFSLYCHLSEILVNSGDMPSQGSIIAKTGNTGRSTGPHLHWGMRVNGHWVNTSSFFPVPGPASAP